MSRPIATQEPSGKCLPLTGPQEAAVAKLAYTAGQPGAIALLCGPAGVGKTTVLRAMAADGLPKSQTIRLMPWADIRADRGDLAAGRMRAAASDDDSFPHVLLIDDAHRAVAAELVEFVELCRRRHDGIAIVLAGEGRLLSLVASDARLEQAVRLRATVPTFTLAESRRVFGPTLAFNAAEADGEAVIRTIHEIAGGVPAIAVRLAEMLAMLAAADPRRDLTPDDVEAIHRRLSLSAA
ncbi:MAG: ATP-binding protein [Planctomycetia bacterium]|nr:ATP-binding protein [Planctomycetia bacterium]